MEKSMGKKEIVPLLFQYENGNLVDNNMFGYYPDQIMPLVDELNDFLEDESWCKTIEFVKSTLFPYEVKYNNEIENYMDPITLVKDFRPGFVVPQDGALTQQQQRIINLSRGYSYILQGKPITTPNLAKLYEILSAKILDSKESLLAGQIYRHDEVDIYTSSIITAPPEQGVKSENVKPMMENLLEFANEPINPENMVDTFIRSQILHYQFVYIHPYFDINGRTARTTGLWYLINNNAFPFTLFNRAIHHDKSAYYRVIKETKKFRNATYFLKYMLNNVAGELEKEFIIKHIQDSITSELSVEDRQILQYMLSNKSLDSARDLTAFYNHFNPKRNSQQIFTSMIEPLVDKNVIKITGYGKKRPDNAFLSLNSRVINNNPAKIKRLDLDKKCS